jgi:hypothetical protein
MHPMSSRQKRNPGLQGDDERYDPERWFPPLLQLGHLVRKFRRVMKKKVGAMFRPRQDKQV